jgi:hypothetical protein
MRRLFALSLSLIFATSAAAAPAPTESWGKAGVSFDQYRQDTVECGREGYYLDIAETTDAKEFVRASRQLDTLNGMTSPGTTSIGPNGQVSTDSVDQMARFAATQRHIIEGVRPDQRYRNIKQTLQATTDRCLVGRGYSKFALTDDQRHRLRKLKVGSAERHTYLFKLASDPTILSTQAIRLPETPAN